VSRSAPTRSGALLHYSRASIGGEESKDADADEHDFFMSVEDEK
jgi:hypothetical protein